MLSKKKQVVPETTYNNNPIIAIVRVRMKLLIFIKKRLVMMIDKAGRLIISCTRISDAFEKCSLMIPMAGAIAAAAMTVRSDIDSIVAVSILDLLFIIFI